MCLRIEHHVKLRKEKKMDYISFERCKELLENALKWINEQESGEDLSAVLREIGLTSEEIRKFDHTPYIPSLTFTIRPMYACERKYTFAQGRQIYMQTGFIGSLRADMGADGKGFFSTWFDSNNALKSAEFKQEFDKVLNRLRENDNILSNRSRLASYCRNTPESSFNDDRSSYGIRVNTEKYTYLIRLNPNKNDYNLYCYCYVKEQLDAHLKNANLGICFIDSSYNELFRIFDGGQICITEIDGTKIYRSCRYIDDYHTEIGDTVYHICEFAELMERNGSTYKPAPKS